MKVYWYRYNSGKGNFGDELTPYLLDYLGVPFEWSAPEQAEMFGIGSLMHFIPDGFKGVVWSTGMLTDSGQKNLSRATILGLRGKLSMERVTVNDRGPVCLGDGGLMCDLFYKPARKKYKLGIIPHYVNSLNPLVSEIAAKSREIKVIDICAGVPEVIEQVGQCEHILSSSLHGLILSDSLGIPNEWVEFKEDEKEIIGKGFKFNDYFSNFGISNKRPVVLRSGDTLDTMLPYFQQYDRPGIDSVKENLRKSLKPLMSNSASRLGHSIVNTTSREIELLSMLNSGHFPKVVKEGEVGPSAVEKTAGTPLRDVTNDIVEDPEQMGRFFQECLDILGELRQARIVHRRISPDNIVLHKGTPMLINFGWGLACKQTGAQDRDWQARFNEDILCLGKVFEEINGHRYPLVDWAVKMMSHTDASFRIFEIDVLKALFSHVLERGGEAEVVCRLLDQIHLRDKKLETLRTKILELENGLCSASNALLNLEIEKIIPAGERIILLDDGALAGQIDPGRPWVPFTEKDGCYNGAPKDSAGAIAEVKRQMSKGIRYIVIAWPAFWWLEHYKEWSEYLRSNFPCVLENNRLVIYELRSLSG